MLKTQKGYDLGFRIFSGRDSHINGGGGTEKRPSRQEHHFASAKSPP